MKSTWHPLLVALAVSSTAYAQQDTTTEAQASAADIARELANPNTALGFLAFQLDYVNYGGDLPDAGGQDAWKINFQPSIPYPLAGGVNFFLRPLIPVVIDQPVFAGDGFEDKGVNLGDIGFDAAVGKSFASGLQLIGGVVGALPTATDDALGPDHYRLGPELFIGWTFARGFLGALVSYQRDIGGGDGSRTRITGGQYFYTINLENAWQIQAQPTWSYNHEAADGNKLTFPLGIGVSKTVIAGKTPWKFALQYWNYIASADSFGSEHQIRLQVAPVVPLPW